MPAYISTEQLGAAGLADMYEHDRIKNWFDKLDDAAIDKLKAELLVYFKKNQARADRAFWVISCYKATDGESAEKIMDAEDHPGSYTDI
jgi:hypothetical protein